MSPDHLAELVLIDISQGQRSAFNAAIWKPRVDHMTDRLKLVVNNAAENIRDHMTGMYAAAVKMADGDRKIVTSHVYPPIPIRDYDWCAYFDDLGADCSPYGWGRTEAEARQDLLDNVDE